MSSIPALLQLLDDGSDIHAHTTSEERHEFADHLRELQLALFSKDSAIGHLSELVDELRAENERLTAQGSTQTDAREAP